MRFAHPRELEFIVGYSQYSVADLISECDSMDGPLQHKSEQSFSVSAAMGLYWTDPEPEKDSVL
jgi:hypothetical protein